MEAYLFSLPLPWRPEGCRRRIHQVLGYHTALGQY